MSDTTGNPYPAGAAPYQGAQRGAMNAEVFSQERIRARALGVALSNPSFDDLCHRVAVLSIGFEQALKLADDATKKASSEAHVSDIALYLFKQLEPHLARGKKIVDSARKGNETTYGTKEQKMEQWAVLQREVDRLAGLHKGWSWEEIKRHAAKNMGVSPKTIARRCNRPNLES